MQKQEMSRRALLKGGGAALAGLTVMRVAGPAGAFPSAHGGEVIAWLDQPAPNPVPDVIGRQLQWEALESWLTPPGQFFTIKHYDQPALDEADWGLAIAGLVAQPQRLTLPDLKARCRQEVAFTMECSGNTGLPFFIGGVGNARWAGTPLAAVLEEAGVLEAGREVVFWGADSGTVTVRDNPGVLAAGRTGTVEADAGGGQDLTITEQFARSMSVHDALNAGALLCYEMNGASLPPEHGYPVRLIVPGWYGVANVKWLTRIEVIDQRFQGRFMARDYVTIREENRDAETVWTFTSVAHDRLKSAPAKVTRQGGRYAIMGAAWGAPIGAVDVRIDDGPWTAATLTEGQGEEFAWTFWTFDWGTPAAGEHTVTSRAFDVDGNEQPAPDDPYLAAKRTYWESNGHVTRRVQLP